MILTIKNEDECGRTRTIPKEVLQKSYIDKIGKTINYCATEMKVMSVKISEKNIELELEEIRNSVK